MLKIGEFSQLCQVTVKTLRHYDWIGLLKPAHIDPFTSYRYYTVEQLPRIHRIMALKAMGLSLEQIGLILDEELSTDEIRGMLRLKQAEFAQQIREVQQRQAMIEFRLRMIDAETNFPHLDVVMKRLEPMRFLSFYPPTPKSVDGAMQQMAKSADAITKAIADGHIKHNGVTIDVFHGETILPFESPEIRDRQHEILLGVDSSQQDVRIEGLGRWTVREEPVVETAATLMVPKDESGLEAYEKAILLRRWAVAHEYQPSGLVRFLHHRGPLQTLDRDRFLLEAQLPVDVRENDATG